MVTYEIIETCIGCTACINRCPTNAIYGQRNVIHYIDPVLCVDCGACGTVCPVEAILDDEGDICRKFSKKEWPKAVVDADKCIGKGCELCINVCPFEALELDNTETARDFFGQAVVIEKNCTGCRLCEQSCGLGCGPHIPGSRNAEEEALPGRQAHARTEEIHQDRRAGGLIRIRKLIEERQMPPLLFLCPETSRASASPELSARRSRDRRFARTGRRRLAARPDPRDAPAAPTPVAWSHPPRQRAASGRARPGRRSAGS